MRNVVDLVMKTKENRYFKPACILIMSVMLMYMSVRWVLMQDPEHTLLEANTVSRIAYVVSCLGLAVMTGIIFWLKDRIRLENIFLILYLLLGIMYMTVVPLSSTPDETEHMLRSYGISQGDFIPESTATGEGGSYVPANITYMWNRGGTTLKDMYDNLTMEADENRIFLTYSNTALYSPLTYAPQALGVFLGKHVCNRPYIWAYMGRAFNMITVGVLLFLSIRITPMGKNIIFVLAMLPINMYECISLSGGPLAFSVTVLLISYTLWLRYVKTGEMNKKEKLFLYMLLLFSASCKIVYVPFVLMAFAVPQERFGDKKKYFFHVVCATVMILSASFGWVLISKRYLIEYTEGVDSIAQIKFILMHPFKYLQIIVNTIMQLGEWIIRTFFAGSLGYFDVGGSLVMMVISAANLIYVCVTEKLNVSGLPDGRSNDDKEFFLPMILMFISTVISCLLVLSSEYIQWTPYMNPSIDGLQGRYFLPLILPFVYLVKKKKCLPDGNGGPYGSQNNPYSKMFICFVNLITIITLFIHYI